MSRIIILDSEPVGLLTNANVPPLTVAINAWISAHLSAGNRVVLPEVIDYEIRREFEMNRMLKSLMLLDALPLRIEYLGITTAMWRQATLFWAQARRSGLPTAAKTALDIDVILAAQAHSLGTSIIVATSNVAHLSQFVPADLWRNIVP